MRQLALTSTVETVVIRPGTFFGPGDHLHFGRIAQRMKNGKGLIVGRGDNALPFCYVTDVVQGFLLGAYHPQAPGNAYNISNDRPLTQTEIFNAIADGVRGKRPEQHVPYLPLYYGSMVAEKIAALTRTKPMVTQLGAMMFGTDNRHSVEKARRELGYDPKVSIREGISLAAAWFNAGGFEQPTGIQAGQPTLLPEAGQAQHA
jgi:nucleoside-diphosphate-sugar epimerase